MIIHIFFPQGKKTHNSIINIKKDTSHMINRYALRSRIRRRKLKHDDDVVEVEVTSQANDSVLSS